MSVRQIFAISTCLATILTAFLLFGYLSNRLVLADSA